MGYTKKTDTTNTEVKKNTKTTVVKEVRKFQPGDMILCRCVRPNKVIFHSSKTDTRYEFGGYGDVNEVDYSDLLKLKSSRSPILYQPKILIEDEELRDLWKKDFGEIIDEYDGVYNTEELFDRSPDDFERFLRNASNSIKELVKVSASNLINEEKLTDLRIIRIVDDILGTSYKDFI